MKTTGEMLEFMMKSRLAYSMNTLEEWNNKFLADPTHSLEWSNEIFSAAAENEMYEKLLDIWNETKDVAALLKIATKELSRRASYLPQSSSQASNLMDLRRLECWARFQGELNDFMDHAVEGK